MAWAFPVSTASVYTPTHCSERKLLGGWQRLINKEVDFRLLIAPRFDTLEWIVGFLILMLLLGTFWHRKKKFLFLLVFSVIWVYLLALLNATVFPLPEYRVIRNDERQYWTAIILANINLVPFQYGDFARFGYVFPEIVSNILLTVPFGFGLNFLIKVRPRDIFIVGLALSILIEFAQLSVDLLFATMAHVVDINDVLWNTIGVILGFAAFRVVSWVWLKFGKSPGAQNNWLSVYFYEVAVQEQDDDKVKNA